MKLNEINNLIAIRNYVHNSLDNPYAFERNVINELNGMLILIDKKLIELLRTDEFKEYINYKDVKKAIHEVAVITNIKSGLKK